MRTPSATAASSTLKVPSTRTSSASRGSSAHWVMRIAAWWKTTSMPLGQLVHELAVADVALDDPDDAVGASPRRGFPAAADEVVEHDDLLGARLDQLIDEVGADGARAARHQDALAAQ